MSYIFYCSKCKFDHAGECPPKDIAINPDAPPVKRSVIDSIRELVKALEAGNYNAKPGTLHQCKWNPYDCDVCYPPGTITDIDASVMDGNISISYHMKMTSPLTFIPITFQIT